MYRPERLAILPIFSLTSPWHATIHGILATPLEWGVSTSNWKFNAPLQCNGSEFISSRPMSSSDVNPSIGVPSTFLTTPTLQFKILSWMKGSCILYFPLPFATSPQRNYYRQKCLLEDLYAILRHYEKPLRSSNRMMVIWRMSMIRWSRRLITS